MVAGGPSSDALNGQTSGALAPTASQYASALHRRLPIIVPTLLILPLAALLLSLSQQPVYQGSAEVLLGGTNLSAALAGVQDASSGSQSDRVAATQANLARVPDLARRTLTVAGVRDRSTRDLLRDSSVSPKPNADLLEFKVRDRDRALAARLATEYARQYTIAKHRLDTAALDSAQRAVQKQIEMLRAGGATGGSVLSNLLATEQRLATMKALQTSNATLVRTADQAEQIAPRPKRAFLLGLGLAIVLALGLAFAWEGLDTRVQSVSEIWQRLGLPLLAVVPGKLEEAARPPLLVDPRSQTAESFRVLRANVELANLDRGARVVMVTSAEERDGRAAVAANLAIAFARAGREVILVDLDLRRPTLAPMFGLRQRPGLVETALGTSETPRPLAEIRLERAARSVQSPKRNGNASPQGRLQVLVAGRVDAKHGELVGTDALVEVLDGLRDAADLVFLNAPPLLSDGDAIALGATVDALIVVVRLADVSRATLDELKRALDSSPAVTLGVVVTEADGKGASERRAAPARRRSSRSAAITKAARRGVGGAAETVSGLRRHLW